MYSLVLLLLTAVGCLALATSHDYYQCEPCRGDECDAVPEGCLYGMGRDACGRVQCKAGPGRRCGGRENHLGKCGEGMNCVCGKCRGCSIDRLMTGVVECDYTNPICS